MDTDRWEAIERILDEVLAHPPEARTGVLDRLCAEDEALRREVEDLLDSFDAAEADNFLSVVPRAVEENRLLLAELAVLPVEDLEEGQQVGAYRILRLLGRGGMGSVYLAERADGQFRKQIALKVIKRGMDTREVLQRFRYEREILARFEHPNVARLLDAGATDDGRPYVAMEYVEGERIDHYCDQHQLAVRERLDLFRTVCEAVGYAHRNLVVHRDLKPSNILVSHDGTVKLLDFGIAKLLDDDAAGTVLLTQTGTRRMTPSYAAPEQIIGAPITTATDVYALGVMLFELLTGRRPYQLSGHTLPDIQQIICEKIPGKPSTIALRPVHGDEEVTTTEALSRQRAATPKHLHRLLAGDLDAITLKALKKEPERRYTSAMELSDDLHRHLTGRPVVAQDDTVRYRTLKFIQRHKVAVTAAALVVASLVAGIVGTATQAQRAQEEAIRANEQASRALAARDFVVGTFALADPDAVVDPSLALGETFTRQDLIAANLARIDELTAPLDRAAVMDALGQVCISFGLFETADSLYRQALHIKQSTEGHPPSDLAETLFGLGLAAQNMQQNERADSLYRQALDILTNASGSERRLMLNVQNNLAFVLTRQGRSEEATEWYEKALALGNALAEEGTTDKELQLDRVKTRRGLATVLRRQEQFDEAEKRYREALALIIEALGDRHPETANVLYTLANLLKDKGDYSMAEQLHLRALDIYQQTYPHNHPVLARSYYTLAQLYHTKLKDHAKAASLYQQTLSIERALLDPNDINFVSTLIGYGQLLVEQKEMERAEPMLREALSIYQLNGVSSQDPYVAYTKYWLGVALLEQAHYQEAEVLLRESYAVYNDTKLPRLKDVLQALVLLYEVREQPDSAAVYARRLEQVEVAN